MARAPRLALLTLPSLDHFTGDLLEHLPAVAGWEVRNFRITNAHPSALIPVFAWLDEPSRDALWFEFCWPPFPAMIRATEFGGRRVIVRVHRIEATETSHVENTPWEKVNDVIVVSPDMRRRVLTAAPEIEVTSRLHLICNGVDTARFTPGQDWSPFRIGWCGLMTLRKNPALALEILARLRQLDPRYCLRMCGMGGEPLANELFVHMVGRLGLQDAIAWGGHIAQADMPAWHMQNGVLLHTSFHEGLSYAVLEAAASGCDLAVFDSPGTAECWPACTLFRTVDEAIALIHAAVPGRWLSYVSERYTLQRQLFAFSTMLNDNA